jgi:glycosyltransferase involved in cell wall biosynthesis
VSTSPLVSVCVPTYNGRAYLRECLDSALGQTISDIEVLVIDDSSQDDSVAIAQEYARSDPRVRVFVNRQNMGLPLNWNRCIDLSEGEWIKFLLQDDHLEPTCLQAMLKVRHEGFSLVVCDRKTRCEPDTPAVLRQAYEVGVANHNLTRHFPGLEAISATRFADHMLDYPVQNCIGEPTTTLIHRSAFRRFGRFSSELIQLADWEYQARVAVNVGLYHVGEALATFRLHGRSSTAASSERRVYRKDVIDPLLVEYALATSRVYRPVRAAAKRRTPAISLMSRLMAAIDAAEALAVTHAAKTELRETAKRHAGLRWSRTMWKAGRAVRRRVPIGSVIRSTGRGVRRLLSRNW